MKLTYIVRVFLIIFACFNCAAYASTPAELTTSRALIDEMLSEYQAAYPDITFVHLQDSLDLDRLGEVYDALGEQAENVDYEHTPSTREMLLSAQRRRIEIMLEEQLPSATLFKTSTQTGRENYICVLTIDPMLFAGDPGSATSLFSDGLDFEAQAKLENETMLRFTIDHEVFHCLDAYVHGPTRSRTDSFVTASYDDYRAEQRADLYAGFALQAREQGGEIFLRTLAMYRTFAILDWDLEHYSAPILFKILDLDASFSAGLTLPGRVRFAMGLADHWLQTAEQYQAFAICAAEVAMASNRAVAYSPLYQELLGTEYEADPTMVSDLNNMLRRAKSFLVTRTVAELER